MNSLYTQIMLNLFKSINYNEPPKNSPTYGNRLYLLHFVRLFHPKVGFCKRRFNNGSLITGMWLKLLQLKHSKKGIKRHCSILWEFNDINYFVLALEIRTGTACCYACWQSDSSGYFFACFGMGSTGIWTEDPCRTLGAGVGRDCSGTCSYDHSPHRRAIVYSPLFLILKRWNSEH